MNSLLKIVSLLCFSLITIACTHTQQNPAPAQPAATPAVSELQNEVYDANSWKHIIADSCQSFSDGCNTCTRMPDAEAAACTRKACIKYEKPRCLDKVKALYSCAGEKSFTVYYREYVSGDQKVNLKQDQVMLVDSQTRSANALTREPGASGSKYSGGGLTFWEKGDEAMLQLGGKPLYDACHKR